ncbi:MAG: radical SAM family heme chaperone HemW [Wenzhouxiangella sp.]
MLQTPPLSLYIHIPWCVVKCPYCDFNSHAVKGELPEQAYIDALLADLELDLPQVWGRTVHSIFIGGGTPSLFSGQAMDRLLSGVRARLPLAPDAEITMEANPGTVEHDRFEHYRAAGINRISLGIQSFKSQHLKTLGRIHDGDQAQRAVEAVKAAGFERFNLDLMWALPGQTVDQALADVDQALAFAPGHLSHYQLTIEPNTVFAARPPALPEEDLAWDIQEACAERLAAAGFQPYEISAWTQANQASRHNLNYWRFGDYLGIGAGAHAKISLPAEQTIVRLRRKTVPHSYLQAAADRAFIAERRELTPQDRIFEYFLNRLRLAEPCPLTEFEARTGLGRDQLDAPLMRASQLGLIEVNDGLIHRSEQGARYLNDLQALFLPA